MVALLPVAFFGAACLALLSPFSDFVYHWGIKANRFYLRQGIDWDYLVRPENAYAHPDYPNLIPETWAITSILSGRFDEAVLFSWSALFFALLIVEASAVLRETGASRLARTGLIGLSAALAAFCIGYNQSGSADIPFALALLIGSWALQRGDQAMWSRLAIAAAFAASVKIEGLVLAGTLIGLGLLRRRCPGAWRWLWLPLVLGGLWAIRVWQFGLLLPTNTGAFDWSRLGLVGSELWRVLQWTQWHGLSLTILVLPLLFLSRRTVWVAAVLSVQTLFYVTTYMTAPALIRINPGMIR